MPEISVIVTCIPINQNLLAGTANQPTNTKSIAHSVMLESPTTVSHDHFQSTGKCSHVLI